jgi:hypothetical protein
MLWVNKVLVYVMRKAENGIGEEGIGGSRRRVRIESTGNERKDKNGREEDRKDCNGREEDRKDWQGRGKGRIERGGREKIERVGNRDD